MSRIWKAWAGWRGLEDDVPTGVAPSTDWGDYWVRKGIDEALKKPDELREILHNLRHSTYVVVGVAAGLLLGIVGTMQILYADSSPEWRRYLTPFIVYILGWIGVLVAVLYVHYPTKNVGMDIYPDRCLQYTTRDQAKIFIDGIQDRVRKSRKPLETRAKAVKIAIWSVVVQIVSVVLATIEGIIP